MEICKKRRNCVAKSICAMNIILDGCNCKQFYEALEEKLKSPNSDYAATLLKWRDTHIDKLSIPAWAEFNKIVGRLHPPKSADDA